MENKLIEKAKSVNPRTQRNVTKEEVELVVSYFSGEITVRQVAYALDVKNPGGVTHHMPRILCEGIKNGWVKIEVL